MALLLLFVGKTKEGFLKEGIRKYETLVGHFLPLEIREIKGASSKEKQTAIEEEADGILSRVLPADFLVVLDERGKELDSVSFSKELGKLMDTGRRLIFVPGGPFGLSDRVRKRADLLLSLSKLTFTHEMARLTLLEQLYRALTIIKGKAYHY